MSSIHSASSQVLPLARAVQERLRTRRLGRPMESYESLGSTNERALAWARDGAPEGNTVVTDHQTDGRGRHGRRWAAQDGRSLTFSVVLRPSEVRSSGEGSRAALPLRRRGLIALAGGLAVCDAIADLGAALTPRLKWPNDVLLDSEKCCGVLVETASTGTSSAPVVLGIGLNVNQHDFPGVPAGRTPPTSLALAAGRSALERAPLLAQLLQHLEARYLSLFEDAGRAVRTACETRMAPLRTRMAVRPTAAGDRVEGAFLGLALDGALRLRTARGERTFHAGDVTTA
jgi:BirA family biotin operon repressor/biotin-[acetyl-CoA-carboxylase] ligase